MIQDKIHTILDNEFTLPEISEAHILGLNKDDDETLVLIMPITSYKNKTKFLRIKPPTFTEHDNFCKELASYQINVLIQNGFIRENEKKVDKQIEIKELIGLMIADNKPAFNLIKKYLRITRNSCSMRWLKKNINIFQLQKILAYMVLLPEAVKKNGMFLAQKLGIVRHLQTLIGHLDKNADGRNPSLAPRF